MYHTTMYHLHLTTMYYFTFTMAPCAFVAFQQKKLRAVLAFVALTGPARMLHDVPMSTHAQQQLE